MDEYMTTKFEVHMSDGSLLHTNYLYGVDTVREFIDWIDMHSVRCGADWFIALRNDYENEVYVNVSQIVSAKQRR